MSKLTKKQQDFLSKVTAWGWFIENQTAVKAAEFKSMQSYGLKTTAFILYVIVKSKWGEHPLAQESFKSKDANNLTLMRSNEWWTGRKAKFDGQEYKLFDSWEEFCIHFSDYIVFSGLYKDLLAETDALTQVKLLTREDSSCYNEVIKLLTLLGNHGK